MIAVERHINELMSSNCYLIYNKESKHCIIVDPASEMCYYEIEFLKQNSLCLDYIILTHEHTDHTWGVNALVERFPEVKVVCSADCTKELPKAVRSYFQLYFDRKDYTYQVCRVDEEVQEDSQREWGEHTIRYILTPGHSKGSMCIDIDGMLFTGDTIMPFKPYLNKRDGSIEQYRQSLSKIESLYAPTTIVYPGHGDKDTLEKMIEFVKI